VQLVGFCYNNKCAYSNVAVTSHIVG